MFLSSLDSLDLFPNNTFDRFIVDLGTEINLESQGVLGFNQSWSVALTELSLRVDSGQVQILPESAIVACDLTVPSYVNNTQRSLLRILPATQHFTASLHLPYYIAVAKLRFSRIRVQLRDSKFAKLAVEKGWPTKGELTCTLHFLKS